MKSLHAAVTQELGESGVKPPRERVHARLRGWGRALVAGEGEGGSGFIRNTWSIFDCGHANHNRALSCAHHATCECRVQGTGVLDASAESQLECGDDTRADFEAMWNASESGGPYSLKNKNFVCQALSLSRSRSLQEEMCPGKPLEAEASTWIQRQGAIISQTLALSRPSSRRAIAKAGGASLGEGGAAHDDADGGANEAKLPTKQLTTIYREGFAELELAAARGGHVAACILMKEEAPSIVSSTPREQADGQGRGLVTRPSVTMFAPSVPGMGLCSCKGDEPCGLRCKLLIGKFVERLAAGKLTGSIYDMLDYHPTGAHHSPAPRRSGKRARRDHGGPQPAPDLEVMRSQIADLQAEVRRLSQRQ
jgi:hypothetical protein